MFDDIDKCKKCLQVNKTDSIHSTLKSDNSINSSHLFQMYSLSLLSYLEMIQY